MVETLYASSHLAGTFATPDNAVGNTPATWAGVLDTNTNYTSRWAMANPVDPLTAAATQTIEVVARKGTATGTPTIALNLYDNGTLVGSILAATNVTSQVGQTLTATFNTSQVSSGANVEIEVVQTGAGGPVGTRNSAQISTIKWTADTGVAADVGYGRVLWVELETPPAPPSSTMRVSWVEWQFPGFSSTMRVANVLWQWPLKPGLRSWRIDYTDDGITATSSHTSDQGPPTRTTGVLAVIYWYDAPYHGLHYGVMDPDKYVVDGVELTGETIGDADWETYRLGIHSEAHPYEGG